MDQEANGELRRALRAWDAGEPSAELDRRVRQSFRAMAGEGRGSRRLWFRYGIPAACMAGLAMAAVWIAPHGGGRRGPLRMDSALTDARQGPAYETQVDSSGFRPVGDARIVVVTKGEQR